MRLLYPALFLVSSLFAQTTPESVADRMLARIDGARWNAVYAASKSCQRWTPIQMMIHATEEWTHQCTSRADGLIEDSFFYTFDESRPALSDAGVAGFQRAGRTGSGLARFHQRQSISGVRHGVVRCGISGPAVRPADCKIAKWQIAE